MEELRRRVVRQSRQRVGGRRGRCGGRAGGVQAVGVEGGAHSAVVGDVLALRVQAVYLQHEPTTSKRLLLPSDNLIYNLRVVSSRVMYLRRYHYHKGFAVIIVL